MQPLPGWYKGTKKECPRCGSIVWTVDMVPDGQKGTKVCIKCRDASESERSYTDGGSQ